MWAGGRAGAVTISAMAESAHESLPSLVGRTPLVELQGMAPKPGVRIFAKLEGQNPSGSVKDRIVMSMLDVAEARGMLRGSGTLVEASTGNTAIALAALAPRRGYRVRVILPRGIVPSVADILDLYGADIEWCEPEGGMRGAIQRAQELASQPDHYALGQFTEQANVECHYATTGLEIASAVERVDVFIAGIGTGGTVMGVARRLRERWPAVQVIGVEPRLGDRLQGLRSLSEGIHAAAAGPYAAGQAVHRGQRERDSGGEAGDPRRRRLRGGVVRRYAAYGPARRRGYGRGEHRGDVL